MLISLTRDHKEHLNLLIGQPEQVIADFCKLSSDFLQNGPNHKLYLTAAKRLEVEVQLVQSAIYGLIQLLLLGCKHQLNDADFRDSVLTVGFNEEQEAVLSHFYKSKQDEIKSLSRNGITEAHYNDLQWRFEVQLSSRSLLHQTTPLITMDLTTKVYENEVAEPKIDHNLIQTDPTNMVHITNELENALAESRSRHSRKIQRILGNLQI